jgi:hypothetical protein
MRWRTILDTAMGVPLAKASDGKMSYKTIPCYQEFEDPKIGS